MIKVLKQALKAFEVATTPLAKDRQEVFEAVAAINQAIAELESQKPVAWRTFDGEGQYESRAYEENESYADEWDKRNPNHKGWVDPLYTHPPQRTEQEPALYWSFEVEYALRPSKYDEEDHPTHEPLYRKPPQRKPLTDDQITLIIADCASSHQHLDIHLARAIEAAHGITGENK